MVTIMPMQGVRYNKEKAGKLADLVAPPYDVINKEQQAELYRRNPYNMIRLEYGETFESDDENTNQYARAAEFFKNWRAQNILTKDDKPALYLYQQEFNAAGMRLTRTGFFARVKLEPYDKKIVVPHEETIPKHKEDRLELMRHCKANFSPVFGLFADKDRRIDSFMLSSAEGSAPDIEFTDENDQVHRMWIITDNDVVHRVQEAMSDRQVFIADGHHRYETALAYREERRREEPDTVPGERPYDYVMMTLVNLFDPGLVILPTHRLVKHAGSIDEFLKNVENEFEVEKLDVQKYKQSPLKIEELLMDRANLSYQTQTEKTAHVFAVYTGENLYALTLKDENKVNEIMPPDSSESWNNLDVSVLQQMILERYLGIGAQERASGEYLDYTRDAKEVFQEVDGGSCELGIFMNPTMVKEVIEVADQGEKMPQKSTYFYPKLITGLLINEL